MATYEKKDFEDGNVGISTTVEFNMLLNFIHAYNKGKKLGEANGLSEEAFADQVCSKLGWSSSGADLLKKAKALNRNHRLGEVPNESDEKTLCEDFRAYATAEIDAKKAEKDAIDQKIDEEKNYVAEYNRAVRTVKNARRAAWGPFALWGAIGFAGTVVLTAVLPAIAGITMLGGVFTTGFAGLATLATGVIGGTRGLFGENGRLKKLQDAKDALSAKRQPELQKLLAEQAQLERELNTLANANFKGKDSVSSTLNTTIANDKIGFQTEIENIYNRVVTGNTGYLTAGIGKGESDRVKGEKQRIITDLENLKNMSAADLSVEKLTEAKNLEAEANGFDVAHIHDKAQHTVDAIIAHNDMIDEFVKTLPDTITTDPQIENRIKNIKNITNGYSATNIILHENDTQARLEQTERNIGNEVILAKAEIAKVWASHNEKLADTNPKASEYKAIIEAVKDGGAYQQSIENNNNISNDPTKTEEERENAKKEVERIGKYTELLLQKARLMKALESATNNGNKFENIDGNKWELSKFQEAIDTEIDNVKSSIDGLNSGTEPNLKKISEEVNKIEANLKLQKDAKTSGKSKPTKAKVTTVNNKQRNRVKMQIANIYKEIENAKKSVSYADLNNIFTQDVKDMIAEFEEAHTNSYYKQIDNLTDVSTFKDKAQEIVDRAEKAKKDALEKIEENKKELERQKKDNAELKQKQADAKKEIDDIYNEIEEAKNYIPSDYLDQIFNGDVEMLLAGFDTKNTNSYFSQIDKLTDASTFETDAQTIIKDAEQAKNDAIQKIYENKKVLLNSKRTEAKNEIQDAPKTFEQMYNGFMDKNIGCFASNYKNGYISLANKLEGKIRTASADVDSIIDIEALDILDNVVRHFYTYFEDLKSELDKVGKDAGAMQDLYDSWFKKGDKVNNKKATLENKLREIQGISQEHINGALQYFDDSIIEIKNRIDGRIDELTLDDLRSGLNDENFNLLITQIVDQVSQQVGKENLGDGETPGLEPAKNPENHTTGETGIIPITRQRGEITQPGDPEKRTTDETGIIPITRERGEITLPGNPEKHTIDETGMTIITRQGEEITLPGNPDEHTTKDTGANPGGDKTGTEQPEKPETEPAKDKRPDEHTLFEKKLDETIVNVKKSIAKLLIVNSRITVTYKNGTKQKMSLRDMENYIKEFDPSYKDVVGKKLGLARTVEKPQDELIALYIALQQMGKENGEEREM